jgi:anti-sigma-K factor RskA
VDVSEHRDEHLDLCAAYAVGSLDEADRRRFEEHVASGCPECAKALAEFSEAVVLLGASAPAARPSPLLRERVLAAARAERPGATAPRPRVIEMPRRSSMPWTGWAWAAAAAMLAITTMLSWNTVNRLRDELAATRVQIGDLERQLVSERKWAEVLAAPGARVAQLQITPAGVAELRARATYDPARNAAVIVFENVTPPEGRDYELWAVEGQGVASLGVIRADEQGRAVMRLENVGDPATLGGFAVSLEPRGGSPSKTAPSGPVVMAGTFGS